jgi:hypothetical protein
MYNKTIGNVKERVAETSRLARDILDRWSRIRGYSSHGFIACELKTS